jgi:Tol biopolymer transport system component
MKLILILVLSAFFVMLDALIPTFPDDPAISPDGLSVCFSWNGDLFRVPYEGGVAVRLTSSPGDEVNPIYSPDGSLIAYQGSKDGYSTIYLIPALGGDARELPAANLSLWAWFPDGKKLLVTDGILASSFLSLNLENGSLEHVSGLAGSFADISIDGNKLVYCSDGDPFRKGYRGTLNGDLWEIDLVSQKYTQLTSTDYTERYPVYSKVNPNTIYYAAPSEGQFQLFRVNTNTISTPEQLTSFRDFSVRDISIATNSDRLVFEHFNQIMCWDDKTGKAKALQIEIREDVFPGNIQYKHCENKLKNCCVSPDGKWILFCQDYDLFAVPVEGGDVKQITQDQPLIVDFVILSDSRTFLLSTQDRDGHSLYRGDISLPTSLKKMPWDKAKTIEKLGMDRDSLVYISYSQRNQPNRRVYYDSSAEVMMFEVRDESVEQGIISPDKKWFIYLNNETNANLALKIREIGKSESTLLASYKDAWVQTLALSSDNRSLFVNLGNKIIRYDLIPENEYSHEKNGWSKIIGQDSDKKVASKPVEISMLSRQKIWMNGGKQW